MAVPKKRTGHSAQGKRRSNWKATKPATTKCPNCGETVLAHTVCTACGYYKGKVVSRKSPDFAKEAATKAVKETVKETAEETVKETVKETAKKTTKKTTKEKATKTAKKTTAKKTTKKVKEEKTEK